MIAHVHDPIDGWGGGPGPLPTSEVRAWHATIASTHIIAHMLYSSKILTIQSNKTPRDHVGQKGCERARPSRGVGGMEANTPTHAK